MIVRNGRAKCLAMAGKGGTGKTTLSGLLIKYLIKKALTPILAVDADANANLNEILGVEVETTLGEIRDRMKSDTPANMTKNEFMEMHINQAIIEEKGFDLIVMGQPEGPGCYCMANSILAQVIEKLMKNYKYLIVDNEAGMEHLSRLNLRDIEVLFIVSDASSRGVLTATRIASLTSALGVNVGEKVLIVNRAPQDIPDALNSQVEKAVSKTALVFGGYIRQSDEIFRYEVEQIPILKMDGSSQPVREAFSIFEKFFPLYNTAACP